MELLKLKYILMQLKPGDKVIIHDDLLATGGTAVAAAKLIQSQGAEILGFSFVVELAFLEGRKTFRGIYIKHN